MLSLDRQAATLRDADGQLRGHLSDRRTEDGEGERFLWLVGGKVASCRIFMGCCKGMVCMCVQCQFVCVNSAPPSPQQTLVRGTAA